MDKELSNYRTAINKNFPTLTIKNLEYLSEGWESVAVVMNDELIFRFPKSALAQAGLRTEIQLLPILSRQVSLAIPQFGYVADPPGSATPFAFVGYPMIQGESWEDWPLDLWGEDWWRPILGEFLTTLHAFPVELAQQLSVRNYNLVGKLTGDLSIPEPANWREMIEAFYQQTRQTVNPLISTDWQTALTDRFDSFLADERHFQFQPTLLHADFSEDHVILDFEQHRITGIIDFGDVGIGDPALDVWPILLPHYGGPTDPTFEERHTFYLHMFAPLNGIIFGLAHNDDLLVEEGLEELGESLDVEDED